MDFSEVESKIATADHEVDDKTEDSADKPNTDKNEKPILSEMDQEGKDLLQSDISVDIKEVDVVFDKFQMNESCGNVVSPLKKDGDSVSKNTSGPQEEKGGSLEIFDATTEAIVKDNHGQKVADIVADESGGNEQNTAESVRGLVKSLSNICCENTVTTPPKDNESKSIQEQIIEQGNNEELEFYIPNVGINDDEDNENVVADTIGADKVQVNEKSEVLQNQPIQSCNLFSSGNIADEIEKSRSQNETIVQQQNEPQILPYPPGFEPEENIENQHVQQPNQQQQQLLDEDTDYAGDSASTIAENEKAPSLDVQPTESFDSAMDKYFTKFLETDSSHLDVEEIKSFASKVPSGFTVSEDRYPTLFKALFKVKEISNKAVSDGILAVLKKLFCNLDYNKFLVQFWSCDRIKNRKKGPIGFSFTSATLVLSGNLPRDEREITRINEKAIEAAWSMLLDIDSTVKNMMEHAVTNKAMNPFYTAVFRKLRCLGEYMICIDGKNLPIFFHFYRRSFGDSEGNKLVISLILMANVCKSPKGKTDGSLMKPNFAFHEIMTHLVRDDEKHEKYMLALKQFFSQTDGFELKMEWKSQSADFENPAVFFKSFIKYYNRKQTIVENNNVFFIFKEFENSLTQVEMKIENLEKLDDNLEVDWPFVYKIVDLLGIQKFQHKIPSSLFMILPEEAMGKFSFYSDEEPSLEKALTAIVELHFVTARKIPDALYKNLWAYYSPSDKDMMDIFASSIIAAYNNLKSTIDVKFGLQFTDFLVQICTVCLRPDFVQCITRTYTTDFAFINANSYLIVIVRTLRALVEKQVVNRGKIAFKSFSPFFYSLINLFKSSCTEKFGQIRDDTRGTWSPWRRGSAECMADEMSMAINHLLNVVQKDLYYVFDQTFSHGSSFIDVMIFLCKQRKYYGVNHPKFDVVLLEKIPNFYEPPAPQRTVQGQSNFSRNQENRNDDYGQRQTYQNRGGYGYAPRGRGYSSYRVYDEPQQNYDQNGRYQQQRGYSGFSGSTSENDRQNRNQVGYQGRGNELETPPNNGYSGFSGGASGNDNQNGRGRDGGGEAEAPPNRGYNGYRQSRGRGGGSRGNGGGGGTPATETIPPEHLEQFDWMD
uniref:Uncharacterized protein n=1 Tax=Panagrolaimus sp. PS1159 TaxID=55785 RepID=A0AC35G1F0_9BILA